MGAIGYLSSGLFVLISKMDFMYRSVVESNTVMLIIPFVTISMYLLGFWSYKAKKGSSSTKKVTMSDRITIIGGILLVSIGIFMGYANLLHRNYNGLTKNIA